MDPLFQVVVLSQTPDPERVIWQAMHQDYSPGFVTPEERIPERYGEAVVKHLLEGNRGHYGPLEHPQITFGVGYFPHTVMQQARTHRVGISFDVQCLAGSTEITFVQTSGKLRKIKIADLYDLWVNGEKAVGKRKGEPAGPHRRDCKKRLKKMHLRVLNEDTGNFEIGHIREVMCSGEQPVYRLTLADGKTLDCTVNHHLYTTQGWQRMGEAVGLIVDTNHQVLAITKDCEVLTNGIVRSDALYTQRNWLKAQLEQGLTTRQIAAQCGCSDKTICYWAKHFQLQLPSGQRRSRKAIVKNGLYRDKTWLQEQIAKGLHVEQIAALAGCAVETVKKWVYAHGLTLNKRPPGTQSPSNKGIKGYTLNLSPERLKRRQINGKSLARRRADFHFWKGSISTECELIGAWTHPPQVHTKFNFICQRCGKTAGKLAEFARTFQPILEPTSWDTKPKSRTRRLKAKPVKVVAVEYLGMQTTYDLEVEGPWHNFVANSIVVHNSFRYTGQQIVALGKELLEKNGIPSSISRLEEVFYIPQTVKQGKAKTRQGLQEISPEALTIIVQQYRSQAIAYYRLVEECGLPYEDARNIIGYGIRQHFVVSFNCRSLMHFLDLRAKEDAQLEIRQLCELIWPHFEAWCPHVAAWYRKNRWGKAKLSP